VRPERVNKWPNSMKDDDDDMHVSALNHLMEDYPGNDFWIAGWMGEPVLVRVW